MKMAVKIMNIIYITIVYVKWLLQLEQILSCIVICNRDIHLLNFQVFDRNETLELYQNMQNKTLLRGMYDAAQEIGMGGHKHDQLYDHSNPNCCS